MDDIAYFENSENLAKKLKSLGIPCGLKPVPAGGHGVGLGNGMQAQGGWQRRFDFGRLDRKCKELLPKVYPRSTTLLWKDILTDRPGYKTRFHDPHAGSNPMRGVFSAKITEELFDLGIARGLAT